MELSGILPITLGVVFAGMLSLWLVSLGTRDVSIVDIFWGLGFVVIVWLAYGLVTTPGPRSLLTAALVSIWGVRLGGYLAWRNLGQGEDYRYAAMRRHHGSRFAMVSLGTVFGLQAILMWVVSLPAQAAIAGGDVPLGLLDAIAALVWATGLFFESVGDLQLARFKSDPANRGKIMDRGLWAWTRHPNYFGDFCVWWGIGLLGVAAGAWWSLLGPAVMTVLLMRVSGAALLESGLKKRKPGYADYIARTPAFFPFPPRAGRTPERVGTASSHRADPPAGERSSPV